MRQSAVPVAVDLIVVPLCLLHRRACDSVPLDVQRRLLSSAGCSRSQRQRRRAAPVTEGGRGTIRCDATRRDARTAHTDCDRNNNDTEQESSEPRERRTAQHRNANQNSADFGLIERTHQKRYKRSSNLNLLMTLSSICCVNGMAIALRVGALESNKEEQFLRLRFLGGKL